MSKAILRVWIFGIAAHSTDIGLDVTRLLTSSEVGQLAEHFDKLTETSNDTVDESSENDGVDEDEDEADEAEYEDDGDDPRDYYKHVFPKTGEEWLCSTKKMFDYTTRILAKLKITRHDYQEFAHRETGEGCVRIPDGGRKAVEVDVEKMIQKDEAGEAEVDDVSSYKMIQKDEADEAEADEADEADDGDDQKMYYKYVFPKTGVEWLCTSRKMFDYTTRILTDHHDRRHDKQEFVNPETGEGCVRIPEKDRSAADVDVRSDKMIQKAAATDTTAQESLRTRQMAGKAYNTVLDTTMGGKCSF